MSFALASRVYPFGFQSLIQDKLPTEQRRAEGLALWQWLFRLTDCLAATSA